jgi:membrane protease YdiL (CAAX protease family)
MKNQKHKALKNALTPKNIVDSVLIILFWWTFWLGTQALFIIDVPYLSALLTSASPESNFIYLTLWIAAINVIAFGIWHWLKRDYSFLKIKDKWDVLGYIAPLALIVALLVTKSTAFNVPIWIYIVAMIITNFCQELLTTGYMQTGLSKTLGPIVAAVITVIMFYLGHFMIADTFSLMGGVMLAGFILFSWLRYVRGNIYLANIVHLTWALVMVLAF